MITKPMNKGAFVVKTSLFNKFISESNNKKNVDKIYMEASKFEKNLSELKRK